MATTTEAQPPGQTRLVATVRTGPRAAANGKVMHTVSTFAGRINVWIDERGLSQVRAAFLLCKLQPRISAIRNHKLKGISLERLIFARTELDQQVEIIVRPSAGSGGGRTSVAA